MSGKEPGERESGWHPQPAGEPPATQERLPEAARAEGSQLSLSKAPLLLSTGGADACTALPLPQHSAARRSGGAAGALLLGQGAQGSLAWVCFPTRLERTRWQSLTAGDASAGCTQAFNLPVPAGATLQCLYF